MTVWTVVYQVPPCMGFSRQEYWSGLPFPHQILQNCDTQFFWAGACCDPLCLAKHEAELSAQRLRDAVSSMTQRGRVQALSSSLRSPAEVFCCFEPNWVSQGEEACGSPLAAQVEGMVHGTRWRSNQGSPGHPLPPWCSGCSSAIGVGQVIIVLFVIELFCVLKQLTHVKCFEQYLKHSKHSKTLNINTVFPCSPLCSCGSDIYFPTYCLS